MDYMTMLQRQVEVAGALRSPPTTPAELLHIHKVMCELSVFISQIGRLATKLQVPLELVFQCLMQLGLGHTSGVAFDKQHRQGNVPMHQAKVLDRNAALHALNIEPKMRELVEEDLLQSHIAHCKDLRTLLRMKVEDGNDLSMARKLVSLAEEYLTHIHRLAEGDGSRMMRLYNADCEADIDACSMGDTAAGGGATAGTVNLGATSNGAPAVAPKPLPSNLVKGVTDECRGVLDSTKPEFARRFEALHHLLQWVQEVEDGPLDAQFVPLLVALQEPLKVQLADKRSAICRLACDTVGFLCLRSKPGVLCGTPKALEVLNSWTEVLLKGVHVTVAAIAEATDATVRDMILSTQGATFLLNHIAGALLRAQQSELRRKCLNYLVLGLVASTHSSRGGSADMSFLSPVGLKGLTMSEESCRRLARLLLILLEDLKGVKIPASVDAKQLKLISSERSAASNYTQPENLYLFETEVLRYNEPSKASAYFVEKLTGDHAESLSPKKTSRDDYANMRSNSSVVDTVVGSKTTTGPAPLQYEDIITVSSAHPPTTAAAPSAHSRHSAPIPPSPKKKGLSAERIAHPPPSHMAMTHDSSDTLCNTTASSGGNSSSSAATSPMVVAGGDRSLGSGAPQYGRRSLHSPSDSGMHPTTGAVGGKNGSPSNSSLTTLSALAPSNRGGGSSGSRRSPSLDYSSGASNGASAAAGSAMRITVNDGALPTQPQPAISAGRRQTSSTASSGSSTSTIPAVLNDSTNRKPHPSQSATSTTSSGSSSRDAALRPCRNESPTPVDALGETGGSFSSSTTLPALPLSLRNLSLGASANGREGSQGNSQLSGSLMRRLSSRGSQ